MDRCDYCNEKGCHWSRHAEARTDVRAWQIEEAKLISPFGDYRGE